MIKELSSVSKVLMSLPEAQDNQSHPKFLTVAQVASILNVSDVFVRRLLRDGLLSGVKLGSAKNSPVRIASRSLKRLLETHTVTGINPSVKTTRKPKKRQPYHGVFGK